jgi:hypothetical protein
MVVVGSQSQASQGKKHKTLSEKQTKAKRAGGLVQVVKQQAQGPKFKSKYHQKKGRELGTNGSHL